mmetsp:Transcript_23049/g.55096  ORF Transcript_23049/g.55096 Transcript_23049/m.55096 type:complete len:221 (+) Transcript_23049:104-766(+)
MAIAANAEPLMRRPRLKSVLWASDMVPFPMNTVAIIMATVTPAPYATRNVIAVLSEPRPMTGRRVGMPSSERPWNMPLTTMLIFTVREDFCAAPSSRSLVKSRPFASWRDSKPMKISEIPIATSAPNTTLATYLLVWRALSLTRKKARPIAIAERPCPKPHRDPILAAGNHDLPMQRGSSAGKWSGPDTAWRPPARAPPKMTLFPMMPARSSPPNIVTCP